MTSLSSPLRNAREALHIHSSGIMKNLRLLRNKYPKVESFDKYQTLVLGNKRPTGKRSPWSWYLGLLNALGFLGLFIGLMLSFCLLFCAHQARAQCSYLGCHLSASTGTSKHQLLHLSYLIRILGWWKEFVSGRYHQFLQKIHQLLPCDLKKIGLSDFSYSIYSKSLIEKSLQVSNYICSSLTWISWYR